MNKFRKFSIGIFGGIVLLSTTCFARTGIVNAPNGLVLRKEASKVAEPITTVSDDATVEILEENGEWYKVKYGAYEGYMFAEYVEAEEIEEAPEAIEPEGLEQTPEVPQEPTKNEEPVNNEVTVYPQNIQTNSNLKIYILPSVTSKVIMNTEIGKTLTINYELNEWVNVSYENTQGWVRKYFINNTVSINDETSTEQNSENNQTDIPENTIVQETKKGYIDVSTSANLRDGASTNSNIIATLLRNTEVIIVGEEGDFYKVEYQNYKGYISKSLVSDVAVTTSRSSEERKVESFNEQIEITCKDNTKGQKIVDFAKQYLGYNYISGGTTPNNGFDCSGFTYYVFNQCGYSLSRLCSVQAKTGKEISKEELQAGDLIFFDNGANGSIGHVGIYIGEGMFIHAANTKRGVVTDTINSGYYNTYYYQARRIVE